MEPAESPKEEPEEKQTEELHDGGSEVTKGLLPAEEVKLVVVEAEPTEAPKEAPDELQGEEVHEEGNEAAKDFPPTEGMLEAAADTPVKSQHVGSAETVKGATSEETSEEQPNVNSKEQAEAEAKTMPENSAGGSTAKTPLAETSGVLHDKQAPQETTATNGTPLRPMIVHHLCLSRSQAVLCPIPNLKRGRQHRQARRPRRTRRKRKANRACPLYLMQGQ
jgi:hypothetical protein